MVLTWGGGWSVPVLPTPDFIFQTKNLKLKKKLEKEKREKKKKQGGHGSCNHTNHFLHGWFSEGICHRIPGTHHSSEVRNKLTNCLLKWEHNFPKKHENFC